MPKQGQVTFDIAVSNHRAAAHSMIPVVVDPKLMAIAGDYLRFLGHYDWHQPAELNRIAAEHGWTGSNILEILLFNSGANAAQAVERFAGSVDHHPSMCDSRYSLIGFAKSGHGNWLGLFGAPVTPPLVDVG